MRQYSKFGWWESIHRAPHACHRAYVDGYYQGWVECPSLPIRRREVPRGMVPLILSWGAPYLLLDPHEPGGKAIPMHSFVAGLHTSYALVETTGMTTCMQVNLTPIGAYVLLGMPLISLTNRVVEFDIVVGKVGQEIVGRLCDAPDWEARFTIIDEFIAGRVEDAREPSACVVWAWHRLIQTNGSLSVATLASEVGYSRKHLTARFRSEFGLPPKSAGRILRFTAALRAIESKGHLGLGRLAQDCGYYDQAHFVRDFTEFAGIPPREYLRRHIPAGGVIDT